MSNQPERADGAGRTDGQDGRDDGTEGRPGVIEPLPPWEAQPPEATRVVINLRGTEFDGYRLEGKLRGRVEVELRDWDVGRYEPDERELVEGHPRPRLPGRLRAARGRRRLAPLVTPAGGSTPEGPSTAGASAAAERRDDERCQLRARLEPARLPTNCRGCATPIRLGEPALRSRRTGALTCATCATAELRPVPAGDPAPGGGNASNEREGQPRADAIEERPR